MRSFIPWSILRWISKGSTTSPPYPKKPSTMPTSSTVPSHQGTATDIKTRIRFLSFSYEKTFSNGLVFMWTILYFLRRLGIEHRITFQTDNAKEFGGKSIDKLDYINRQIFGAPQASLIHIPKGKKEWNAFVEKSHQTDDNEFYIPQLELCQDVREFFWRAMRWQWLYNTKRRHSTIQMTLMEKLLSYRKVPKYAAIFPVTNLDLLGANMRIFFPKQNHSIDGDVLINDQRPFLFFTSKTNSSMVYSTCDCVNS